LAEEVGVDGAVEADGAAEADGTTPTGEVVGGSWLQESMA